MSTTSWSPEYIEKLRSDKAALLAALREIQRLGPTIKNPHFLATIAEKAIEKVEGKPQ